MQLKFAWYTMPAFRDPYSAASSISDNTGNQEHSGCGCRRPRLCLDGYGRVSLSKVESQVSSYKKWYAVNRIFFFDGMAYVTGSERYYSTLNSYVKSLGMTYTMGNPGTTTLKSSIGTLDSIVSYESSGTSSLTIVT